MRIYISGSFTHQNRLRKAADELVKLGHDINSTWLWEGRRPTHVSEEEWHHSLAHTDVAQVFAADCVILDLDGDSTTGGRYIEWGVAVCPGNTKLKITVGPSKVGLMRHLANRHYRNWKELLKHFKELK